MCAILVAYLQMEPLKRGVLGGTPEVAVAQHLGWCRCPVLLCSASVSLPPDRHTYIHKRSPLHVYICHSHTQHMHMHTCMAGACCGTAGMYLQVPSVGVQWSGVKPSPAQYSTRQAQRNEAQHSRAQHVTAQQRAL